jgi:hypothetical protein
MTKGLLLFLFPVLAAAAAAAPAVRPLALGDNERLVYHVSWVFLPAVGEIVVSAHAVSDPRGTHLLRIDSRTGTRGLARLLLPFEARAESLYDSSTSRLIWLGESSEKRGKPNAHSVQFDYAAHVAEYSATTPPGPTRLIPMPRGYPSDLITCLLEARTWPMSPGQTRDALVLFEDEFYQLTIHALGRETVTTPLGTFDTIVLEPRMEKTAPLGMFKRGSTVRVWISQGPVRLPVRFQVDFKIGAGVATLVEYRPPTPGQP